MTYLFKNATAFVSQKFIKTDILVKDSVISEIGTNIQSDGAVAFDLSGKYIFPGFVDVHVHLREPGFSYKETIATGSKACARGGYTTVLTMPNLKPVPDSRENLDIQLDTIKKNAVINVIPFGSITKGELGETLSDMDEMSRDVCGFSDDGRGVQNGEMMKKAMLKTKSLGKIISAHCEDNTLLHGGYIHDGEYCKINGHKGICSESEWGPIKRDIELSKETGCSYHVDHISTKESVELIRKAKAEGVDITCETGPHYLTMNDSMLQEDGRFKMNPPIRSEEDRLALVEGVIDGTIDCLATDHAPHSAEEKSKGLEKSLMGVVGIETAFSVVYTKLVKTGVISLEKLVELLNTNPRKRYNLGSEIAVGQNADLTVFNLEDKYTVNPDDFLSMGKATPFEGWELYGKCLLTMCNGKIVYDNF